MINTENLSTPSYISLGSACYTALSLIPNKGESLPFDSVNNFCDLEAVYEILNDLMNDNFDINKFTELDDKSFNKYGFDLRHFNPHKWSEEPRDQIFIRRFERLKNILKTAENVIFVYYKRERYCFGGEKREPKSIQKIHELFPNTKFYHFDRHAEIPLIKNEWYTPAYLTKYYPTHERLSNLKNMLELDVYSDEDKQYFKKKFLEFYKENYTKVFHRKSAEFEEKNTESDLYKQGWDEGYRNTDEKYNLSTPDVLGIQYYYGLIDGEKAKLL
jgi:hypothetical protein